MVERDSLQQSWDALEPPTIPRDLADEDPLTREAVAWMQQAWAVVEPPLAPPAKPTSVLRLRVLLATAAALWLSVLWSLDRIPRSPLASAALTTAAASPAPPPQLVASDEHAVQILSGNVRLTMLQAVLPAHEPEPES